MITKDYIINAEGLVLACLLLKGYAIDAVGILTLPVTQAGGLR